MEYAKQKEENKNQCNILCNYDAIKYTIAHTPSITAETIETYRDIVRFKEGMHHMYVQAKKDPARQWLPTHYRLTTDDLCLIANNWEVEWKLPS
jgi:hypothetical protein